MMIGSDIVDWQPVMSDAVDEDRFMVPLHIEQDEELIGSRIARVATTKFLDASYIYFYSDVYNDVRGSYLYGSGELSDIDGITLNVNDIVLCKNQFPAYNGLYKVIDKGSIYGYWRMDRTTDMDELGDFQNGVKVDIQEGNVYGSETFVMKIYFTGSPTNINNITQHGSVFFHKQSTVYPYLIKVGNLPKTFPKNVDLISSDDILLASDVNSAEHLNQVIAEINRRVFLDRMTAEDPSGNDYTVGIQRQADIIGYIPAFESDIFGSYSDVQDFKQLYATYFYPSDTIFEEVREALEDCWILPERERAVSLYYKNLYNAFHLIKNGIEDIRNDEILGLTEEFGVSTERKDSEFFNMNDSFSSLYFEPSTDVDSNCTPIPIHNTLHSYREKLSVHNYFCMQGSNKYTVYQRYENTGSGWSKTDENYAENDTTKNAMLSAPETNDSRVIGIGVRSYFINSDSIQVAYYSRGVWSTKMRTDLLPTADDIRKVILLVRFATGGGGTLFEDYYYAQNGISYEEDTGIIETLNDEFENWFYISGMEGWGPWYYGWSELPKLHVGEISPTIEVYLCNHDWNTESFSAWVQNDDDTHLGLLNISGSFGWIEIPVSDFIANMSLDHLSILFLDTLEYNTNRLTPDFSFGTEAYERATPIRACCIHIYKE